MEWLKAKILEGKYPNVKSCTQVELDKYVRLIKPLINIQLRTANSIVKRMQYNSLLKKDV